MGESLDKPKHGAGGGGGGGGKGGKAGGNKGGGELEEQYLGGAR